MINFSILKLIENLHFASNKIKNSFKIKTVECIQFKKCKTSILSY